MKRTYRAVLGVTLCMLILSLSSGCNRDPETLTDQYDEQAMSQAIAEARSTFDTFLKRFHHPKPGDDAFNVKVKIEDENGIEHFWLGDLTLDDEPYSGTIGNDPGIVKHVKLGQKYSFSRADISDWMYMSGGTMQGNYTLRVVMQYMPEDEAEALKKRIGW